MTLITSESCMPKEAAATSQAVVPGRSWAGSYRASAARANGGRAAFASGLETTERSAQQEQSDAVVARVAQSLGADEATTRGWLDAIGASGKYPYIDGYMDAISEVAAHVLAYASQKVESLDDVIGAVIARYGSDDGYRRKTLDGSMNEPKLLLEIGGEVSRRAPAGGNRFRELVDRFSGTGLAYFFHPSDSPGADIPADTQIEEIRYALQDGIVDKIARVERVSGMTTLVFDYLGQQRRVLITDIIDAPPGKPSTAGWVIATGKTTTLSSVVSYILLYACGKWGKGYGTEIIYEVDRQRWLAKKANHNDTASGGPRNFDHPGMDVYVAAAAVASGLGLWRRTRALEVTTDSPQAEQSQAVLEHVARSMQQKEGTRFNQVHYDSNVVNFGIGSWTGPRIATVLDAYETFATEQGTTATLYNYFGGKSGFDDLRSRFRSNSVGVPMAAADKGALESLGADTSWQDAQIRLLAQEVKKYVEAIATDNKYPFIDGYMNAVTEVAAHVIAHALHQHGRVNDLIAEVISNHGGEAAFGQEITIGTMDERKFLGEIGEAVVRRVQSKYQNGVRKRYQDLIAQFDGSGLGYFFDPQDASAGRAQNYGRAATMAASVRSMSAPILPPGATRPAPSRPIRPSRARSLGDPGEVVPDYSQVHNTWQALSLFSEWIQRSMKFRIGVTDTSFFPHSAIAKLRLVDGAGQLLGEGSGFYVGPNTIVTAGHCLVNDDGSRVEGVEVIPGLNGTKDPFGGASVGITGLKPHPKYDPTHYNASYDIGVIKGAPDAPNGQYFEMEELRASYPEGIITCGYAAVGVDPTIQHMDVDAIRELQNGTFIYAAQVRPGSSGGPVFYSLSDQTIRVVGLNVTTYDAQHNRGLRLTDPMIAWINSV
jgi:V8-like Glu-specific endopeptidase